MEYFILNDQREIQSVSMQEWDAWWKESRSTRKDRWYVAQDDLPEALIKTIFLRLSDLNIGYFETWLQSPEEKGSQVHGLFYNHKTYEEALAFHSALVQKFKAQEA